MLGGERLTVRINNCLRLSARFGMMEAMRFCCTELGYLRTKLVASSYPLIEFLVMSTIVVATGNPGKLKEMQAHLGELTWDLELKPAHLEIDENWHHFLRKCSDQGFRGG